MCGITIKGMIIKMILKRTGIVLLTIFSYINHRIQLSNEAEQFVPIGEMVEVNGDKMHIHSEGAGDKTLVFMSGGGTASPVLDFKSLYSLLSENYRIVVVEKKGYGFSDNVDVERDIDKILSETREALHQAEVDGPFILVPHSMSGIEALYWEQEYPSEIEAIIGLDMAVPASYDDFKINLSLIKLTSFVSNLGITRWISSLAESDAIKHGTLTDEEKGLARIIFYRRTLTRPMINEIEEIKPNVNKVKDGSLPDIPMLLFSSNGEGTGFDPEVWRKIHTDYIDQIESGELVYLDTAHYLHAIAYEGIASEIDQFIKNKL